MMQTKVLSSLQCIWFDRSASQNRKAVAEQLATHANDFNRNPLLVFPEGTCVNNEYVVQFKKGVFELGVPICPVAIKYNEVCCASVPLDPSDLTGPEFCERILELSSNELCTAFVFAHDIVGTGMRYLVLGAAVSATRRIRRRFCRTCPEVNRENRRAQGCRMGRIHEILEAK